MKYLKRNIFDDIVKWIDRREVIAVKGPRQSGKTTLLEMLKDFLLTQKHISSDQVFYITFEDRDEREKFEKNPTEYLRHFIAGRPGRFYFLLDEFQYVRQGGQKLKFAYDVFKNVKFIITGSSSLELTQHTAKYMVGRMFSFNLFPFSFGEYMQTKPLNMLNSYKEKYLCIREFMRSGKICDLTEDIYLKDMKNYFEEYLVFGGYPEAVKGPDTDTKTIVLKNIYDTYITRDIIELLKKTDIDKFRDIVRHLAVNTGAQVNYTELASDVKSYFQEIKSYISILNETYIVKSLKPYHKSLTTEIKKNPKIYFLDNGLRNSVISNFNKVSLRTDGGKLVEGAVLGSLLTGCPEKNDIKYWRTKAGAEMDFIVSNGEEIIPVEVKYSKAFPVRVGRGFKSYISAYSPSRAIILTGGYVKIEKIENTTLAFFPVWYFC